MRTIQMDPYTDGGEAGTHQCHMQYKADWKSIALNGHMCFIYLDLGDKW